ncbi:phospholipase D p2 [Podospora conica]|nr:phospholipase D p2 [Schizothecium conicum]
MNPPSGFVHDFLKRLQDQSHAPRRWQNADLPALDTRNASHLDLVVSHSTPQTFHIGTGASIFTDILVPAIATAKHEIILVTCFWAPSKTLDAIHDALTKLASHRRDLLRDGHHLSPLSVRICFSSRSLFQKLFHPQYRDGYVYPAATWKPKLGLPDAELLQAGAIDLRVKSLFFLPFSVMHPKFVIVDRERAFIPSCNVSWESWLEGCVQVTGAAVVSLVRFYALTWDRDLDTERVLSTHIAETPAFDAQAASLHHVSSPAHRRVALPSATSPTPTLILPSSHHWNPQFHPFPWQKAPDAPVTPLNIALLELFDRAQRSIYVQTPNLTCRPVIDALLDALQRGVDVAIVTNRSMMLLEQLVTAGTTTSFCLRSLVRRYRRLTGSRHGRISGGRGRGGDAASRDVEAANTNPGQLSILSFRSRLGAKPDEHEEQPLMAGADRGEEPVHSHLKLTVIDDEFTVLGSGNMDRASWWTSQELGILFHDKELASAVRSGVEGVMDGRFDVVFDARSDRD